MYVASKNRSYQPTETILLTLDENQQVQWNHENLGLVLAKYSIETQWHQPEIKPRQIRQWFRKLDARTMKMLPRELVLF